MRQSQRGGFAARPLPLAARLAPIVLAYALLVLAYCPGDEPSGE